MGRVVVQFDATNDPGMRTHRKYMDALRVATASLEISGAAMSDARRCKMQEPSEALRRDAAKVGRDLARALEKVRAGA